MHKLREYYKFYDVKLHSNPPPKKKTKTQNCKDRNN